MAGGSSAVVLKHLRTLFQDGTAGGISDGLLLERFLSRRDGVAEAAFTALVERHGPMVLRVCRHLLGNTHDAEDASQATFLVLARRAGAIRTSNSVASWLFGVACRVAARTRTDAARRREHERRGAEMATRRVDEGPRLESWPELCEELERLPEKYRRPIVLCHLEGLTYEQAAQHLRCPVRTVHIRLSRGRERLRARLARRGVWLSAGLLGAALVPDPASAAMSAAWADRTVRAAMQFAVGRAATAGACSATVAALAEGVVNSMFLNKLKMAVAALLAGCAAATGAAVLAQQSTPAVPAVTPRGAVADPPRVSEPTPPPDSAAESRELSHDDGKQVGKRSIAGGGHAVRFEAPGDDWSLTAVRLYGSRYGYPQAPDENFKVYLCDEKFQKIAEFPFPYSTFKRGDPKWVTMDVIRTKVPSKFLVCVGFNPTATKGVYVGHDAEGSGSSLVGLPGDEARSFPKGDWMIRARAEPPRKAADPNVGDFPKPRRR